MFIFLLACKPQRRQVSWMNWYSLGLFLPYKWIYCTIYELKSKRLIWLSHKRVGEVLLDQWKHFSENQHENWRFLHIEVEHLYQEVYKCSTASPRLIGQNLIGFDTSEKLHNITHFNIERSKKNLILHPVMFLLLV